MSIKDLLSAEGCIWPNVGYTGYLEESVLWVMPLRLCTCHVSIHCDKVPGKANGSEEGLTLARGSRGCSPSRQTRQHSRRQEQSVAPPPIWEGQGAVIGDASLPSPSYPVLDV